MSRKSKEKFFKIGKDLKSDSHLKPLKGVPNTNLDTYKKSDGKIYSRRKFDKSGIAFVDLDIAHNSHNKSDHAHDIDIKLKIPRLKERELTKKEKKELNKAKKKRRFWND